jgi:hypothetical protein
MEHSLSLLSVSTGELLSRCSLEVSGDFVESLVGQGGAFGIVIVSAGDTEQACSSSCSVDLLASSTCA